MYVHIYVPMYEDALSAQLHRFWIGLSREMSTEIFKKN